MREVLSIAVVATLLVAAIVDVVAAGARTGVGKTHFYYASPTRSGYCSALHHEKFSDRAVAAINELASGRAAKHASTVRTTPSSQTTMACVRRSVSLSHFCLE